MNGGSPEVAISVSGDWSARAWRIEPDASCESRLIPMNVM